MIFEEVFLQSQNHDCLGQILSFLTCNDLANVARTCKVLQQTIFEAEGGNVNLIWQGAEEELTNPWDRQSIFAKKTRRVGINAREHCHLFTVASKAAAARELSDEIEENRIKVDGVLADLMSVRGYDDAKSIEEKKAMASSETRTLQEISDNMTLADASNGDDEEMKQQAREQERENNEKWERLAKLTEPTKTYHHDIFVRVTRTATGEVLSEGFCSSNQKHSWCAGLELSKQYRGLPGMSQGIQVFLDFDSLNQSEEIQTFLRAVSETEGTPGAADNECPGIDLTAVVIDRRDHSIQCLFQNNDQVQQTGVRMSGPGFGYFRSFERREFPVRPRWGSDSIQLGPSITSDLYALGFSLCLYVSPETKKGERHIVPVLEVDVQEDRSAFMHAFTMKFASQYGRPELLG